jgi:TetR/AcrR family transcriptional regulator, transcriptional repressor for nem operon
MPSGLFLTIMSKMTAVSRISYHYHHTFLSQHTDIEALMAGTRKFDETALLDLVINVFWEKGFTATTMLDLAKETGVQRGSLYNAYQNKNTLFLKAFTHYTQQFLQRLEDELTEANAKTAIRKLFSTIAQRLTSDTQCKGCFSTRTIMEAAQQCPDINSCLRHFLDGMEKIVQARLEQACKEKHFLGDPVASARYIVALTRGIAVIERVYHDKSRVTDIYQTALAQMPFANTH